MRAACSNARSISPNSSFTLMRRPWKLRVAGSMPERSGGRTLRMISGKPPGRGDRMLGTRRDDRARNAAGLPLLPEFIENIGQFLGRKVSDEIGGTGAGRAHAHIERAVHAKAEAALRIIQLEGGNAEIQHDAIKVADPMARRGGREDCRTDLRRDGGGPGNCAVRAAPRAIACGSRSIAQTVQSAFSRIARV